MTDRSFERLAVVGAGNMGSGIAQKMATEGFSVTLVDLDDEKVARGMSIIETDAERRRGAPHLHRRAGRGNPATGHRHVALRGSRGRGSGRGSGFRGPRDQEERLPPPRRCLPSRCDSRDQHVFLCGYRACRRDDEAAASRGAALLLSSGKEPAGRGRRRSGDRSGRASARVAPSRGARQDSHRLERFVRVHRQSVLPAVVDRGRAHARRGRREHGHDRRSREEGVRDRHGTIRAHERHGRAHRFSHGHDARPRVRSDVRAAGAPPRADGLGPAVGHHRDAGRQPVRDGRRSTDDRRVLRRRGARRRAASARSKTPTSARAWGCGGDAARSS